MDKSQYFKREKARTLESDMLVGLSARTIFRPCASYYSFLSVLTVLTVNLTSFTITKETLSGYLCEG